MNLVEIDLDVDNYYLKNELNLFKKDTRIAETLDLNRYTRYTSRTFYICPICGNEYRTGNIRYFYEPEINIIGYGIYCTNCKWLIKKDKLIKKIKCVKVYKLD